MKQSSGHLDLSRSPAGWLFVISIFVGAFLGVLIAVYGTYNIFKQHVLDKRYASDSKVTYGSIVDWVEINHYRRGTFWHPKIKVWINFQSIEFVDQYEYFTLKPQKNLQVDKTIEVEYFLDSQFYKLRAKNSYSLNRDKNFYLSLIIPALGISLCMPLLIILGSRRLKQMHSYVAVQ